MKLQPCPFCGALPNWLSKDMSHGTGASGQEPPMRALGCTFAICSIKPKTMWRDTAGWTKVKGWYTVDFDEEAIANWNTRQETPL